MPFFAGFTPGDNFGLPHSRSALNEIREGDLQALQHAMKMDQRQQHRAQYPHWRPQEGSVPPAFYAEQDPSVNSYGQDWQAAQRAGQRQQFPNLLKPPQSSHSDHLLQTATGMLPSSPCDLIEGRSHCSLLTVALDSPWIFFWGRCCHELLISSSNHLTTQQARIV